MELINKSIGKHIKGVKIYAEGLEEIIAVLSKEGGNVEITTDQYKFDDLEELLEKYEKSGNIDEINFQIREPYVSVGFRKNQIWLYAADSNALSIGIYEQVDAILKKWTPKTAVLKNGWYLFTAYVFGQAFFYLGDSILNENYFKVSFVLIVILLTAWASYYFITLLSRFKRTVIPNRRSAEKNFFSRNRDKLILIVIAALAGSFFTLLGTYLYDSYKDDILDVERKKSEFGAKSGKGVELTLWKDR